MKNLFYLLIVVLISGCSFKQESIDSNSYSIDFSQNSKSYKKIDKSILIEEPLVNKSFNSRSIFYSTKPYLFEEYAKNRWMNLPSNMIHNSLLESFQASNIFSLVSQEETKVKYDYVLKTNVIKIYNEIDADKSYAVLKIKFDLLKDEKLVKSFTYDKKVLVAQIKPYEFVNSLNKTLNDIMDDLFKNIGNL
ncbi:MAG: ABC-type transport auxiliary lipoprotein family protein [Aliarcobacter sp.]|nr:ABC-type transport auxiliary lipoprotein family protein [Aliarcobacter sp.]